MDSFYHQRKANASALRNALKIGYIMCWKRPVKVN